MEIRAAASKPTFSPLPAYFTGAVLQETIIEAPARVHSLRVSFAPGARTAGHTHPLGQTLNGRSGFGLPPARGAAARRIAPGDTVWIPPGEVHWHGATPDHAMTHIVIQEAENGLTVTWLELVSEADYASAAG